MTNSILEITENEYLIKLNRSNFNLSFIRSLLKIVEVSNPVNDHDNDGHNLLAFGNGSAAQTHSSEPDYYTSLDEK
ncbi:hypothetical protein [Mucilaginibacter segetis]|uniref:Uncharacterized protein n=1 Tax=Mucilaginibacter segetis TaxID=2793071 RepID=A0A934PRP3_9SPHI|nr:hypothetical protein [Mucilaginibacter segetis]MBK0379548.1 hypothetical protein [Mucilaginibacter segetis]